MRILTARARAILLFIYIYSYIDFMYQFILGTTNAKSARMLSGNKQNIIFRKVTFPKIFLLLFCSLSFSSYLYFIPIRSVEIRNVSKYWIYRTVQKLTITNASMFLLHSFSNFILFQRSKFKRTYRINNNCPRRIYSLYIDSISI